jgi:phenylacetate-coenzyme A ligase PaaK-like adenylate-forming protein
MNQIRNPFPEKKMRTVLSWAISNPRSDFYRLRMPVLPQEAKGGRLAWQKVPLLPKEHIVATPFNQRLFTDRKEIPYIRHTSGTSGKGILIMPRAPFGNYREPFGALGLSCVVNFFLSAPYGFPQLNIGLQTLFGDLNEPDRTAALAQKAGADCIYLTPQGALMFARFLHARQHLKRIKAVVLCGERCTSAQFIEIQKLYSQAVICNSYSTSETREGSIACTCIHDRRTGGSLVMHPLPFFYSEIIEPETGRIIVEYGEIGELVVSVTHAPLPFPLIRYRTGDAARYVQTSCPCKSSGFEVVGRLTILPIRVPLGDISMEKIESALLALGYRATYFEVHYREVRKDGQLLPEFSFVLVGKKIDNVELFVARLLMVNATYSYADGVKDGIYSPLKVSTIQQIPLGTTGKPLPPKIVRH